MQSFVERIRQRVRPFLLRHNIRISRTTDRSRLKGFFNSIRPVSTNYGLVRLGGDGDGGYLIPDDLEGMEICFSPGVSEVANFELDLARRGIRCFLADYSVDGPPIQNELFDFEKKYLGPVEDDMFITLENWVNRKADGKREFILQMDIEGAEYGVIFDTGADALKKFRILVIEFHGMDVLFDKAGFELINLTFKKILRDFDVVHIHPNNCIKPVVNNGFAIPPSLEFTFLRKDRISSKNYTKEFPHVLDRPCVPVLDDFALPKCWYS
jgi:hypothetical protein